MEPYNPLIWKDEVRSPSNTYRVTQNSDGTVTSELAGTQIQQGTNQSAANFGKMDLGIHENSELALVMLQELRQHQRKIKDLSGETIELTLTNSLVYPFNDSKHTVALSKGRDTLNYRVSVELEADTPNVGDFVITDKQLNGFKIAYTGSAPSVSVKCYVVGGMSFYDE